MKCTQFTLAYSFGFLAILLFASALRAGERPNIVFAFADDWGRYASAYAKLEPGGPSDIVSTPNFDQIANEGVLFTQAYVNAPSCTPCRSSLLSGQYFWRTGRGAILQGAIWDDAIPSYPLVLEKSGYQIGHTYKVWSPGTPANQPHGGKRASYASGGSRFNRFSQAVDASRNKQRAKEALLNEVRTNFTSFLDDCPDGKPFCYWFGPTNCHRKWTRGSGKEHWGLEPNDLQGKLPKYLPDVEMVREDFCDYLGEVQAFDAGLGVLLSVLEENKLSDNTIVVVSGDHGIPGIPRGKCNLYDLGTRVPLAIRWPGVCGEGLVVDDFVSLPDLAPTLVEAGGASIPDVMTGKSLVPVLRSQKSGQVDPERTFVLTGRERHVAKARAGELPYPQRSIRTQKYLYIRNFEPSRYAMGDAPGFGAPDGPLPSYDKLEQNTFVAFGDLDASPTKAWMLTNRQKPGVEEMVQLTLGLRPEEELYDVERDPDHMNNLAGDKNYEAVRKELADKMFNLLRESGDPRVTQEIPHYESAPYAGDSSTGK